MKSLSGLFLLITIFFTTTVFSQNFWEQTNGPYGGRLFSVAANKNNTLFIATEGKGMYRYSSKDESWQHLNNNIFGNNITIVFTKDNYVFAGNTKLFRSSDEGETWQVIRDDSTDGNYIKFLTDSVGNIMMCNSVGVYKSTDDGDSWIEICSKEDFSPWSMNMNSKGDFFISGWGGTYRYSLSDSSWTKISYEAIWDFCTDTADNLLAVSNGVIYKSNDKGDSWLSVSEFPGCVFEIIKRNKRGDIFAGGSLGLLKSADNGLTWEDLTKRLTYYYVNDICFDSTGNIYAATSGGGILKSTDNGNTWNELNKGINNSGISHLTVNNGNEIFAATNCNGAFRSTNNGNTWIPLRNGIPIPFNSISSLFISPENNNMYLSFFQNGFNRYGLYRSTDKGEHWTHTPIGSANLSASSIISNFKGHLFAATSDRVYKSTDNGNTWIKKSRGLSIPYNQVLALAIDSSGNIYAGAHNGIFKSTDNGENWKKLSNSPSYRIYHLIINYKNYIIASFQGKGIYRSTDAGESWSSINNGLPDSTSYSLGMDLKGNLFTSFWKEEIYCSTDDGDSWTKFSSGLNNFDIRCFTSTSDGYLFVGTSGDGIYRMKMQPTIIEGEGKSELSFALHQNYPNPFNPSTVISYQLAIGSHITLKIYDILGNEVATLVDEEKPAGEYKVNFNASSLSSGFYFYVLNAGVNRISRKMCLLK